MKPKRSLGGMICELAAVLLVTAAAFAWGKQTAQIQRGYEAIGGEHLFLLTPPVYYIVKRMTMDWIADIREREKGRWPR